MVAAGKVVTDPPAGAQPTMSAATSPSEAASRTTATGRPDTRWPARARSVAVIPGGHLNGRPPIRWKCRWSTDWPPQRPTFVTSRYPPSAMPSSTRQRPRRPRTAGRAAARPPRSGRPPTRCAGAGSRRMWVGARGAMSRNAMTRSSSWTSGRGDLAGDDPAEQAVGGHGPLLRSPQHRLRAHQEPDRPDQPGHQVRDVALAPRALLPDRVVGGGLDADEPAQVRPLDEERDRQVDGVDRQRERAATAARGRRPEGGTRPRPVSARPGPEDERAVATGPTAARARPDSPTRPSRAASAARTAAGSTAGTGRSPGRCATTSSDREECGGHRRDCRVGRRGPSGPAGAASSATQSPSAVRGHDDEAGRLERRPDLGLAVDEDPRRDQRAARPKLVVQAAGQRARARRR